MPAIAPIAGEALVTAVAGETDGDTFTREFADAIGRHRRAVGIGFIVDPGETLDQVEIVRLDGFDMMIGRIAARDLLGIGALVEGWITEGDRTGIDRLIGQARHHGDHGARIDAARQKGAERHLGDQPNTHRLAQTLDDLGHRFADVLNAVRFERNVPILAWLGLPARTASDGQGMAGRQLVDGLEDAARIGHIAIGEVLFHGQRIDLAREQGVFQQCLDLGAEQELTIGPPGIVQRLDTESVAGQEQGLAVAIPEREGEHAAKPLDTAFTPFLPGVDDDLGVTVGAKGVPGGGQFVRQFLEVVDPAVVDHDHCLVFVEERLLS